MNIIYATLNNYSNQVRNKKRGFGLAKWIFLISGIHVDIREFMEIG